MAKKLSGQIIDDYRFIEKVGKTRRRDAVWLAECIYCHEKRNINTRQIRENETLSCPNCTDARGRLLRDDEAEILSMYLEDEPIKTIAYELSVSTRTIYNVLHRNNIKLRRK